MTSRSAELKESSKSNVRKSAAGRLLDKGVIELHTADGRKGWPAAAPYDVIHVGAAAPGTPKVGSSRSCQASTPFIIVSGTEPASENMKCRLKINTFDYRAPAEENISALKHLDGRWTSNRLCHYEPKKSDTTAGEAFGRDGAFSHQCGTGRNPLILS